MARKVKGPDGVTRIFPDDATDAEIGAALETLATAAPVSGPHPESKIGAAPEPDDFEKFYGRPNPIGPKARAFMTSPLAEPTGIESVDSLTSPLNLALAAGSIGRVAAKPGLKLAGRIGAAGMEAAGQVLPVVKYEAAKQALEAMHVPAPVAAVIAMGIAGYKKGAKVPTTEPTAAPSPAPTAAVPSEPPILADDGRPWGTPKPTLSLEQLRAKIATMPPAAETPAPRAPRPAPAAAAPAPAPEVAPAVESAPAAAPVSRARVLPPNESFPAAQAAFKAAGLKPGPAELNNTTILMGKGKSADEAMRLVVSKRPGGAPLDPAAELAARLGTPSAAEVDATIDARNARGELKTPSAATAKARRAGTEVTPQPVQTEPQPAMAEPVVAPEPVAAQPVAEPIAQPVKPKRAAKAKVTTPPAAAAEVRQHIERVIDVQGLKTGKEVQGRVLDALQQELPAAQQAAGFQSLEFRPGKAYGGREGVVVVDGQPLARVDRSGKMTWLDDTSAYTTAQGKYVPSVPSGRGDIGFRGTDMTPSEIAKEAKNQVANAIGKGAGLLKINVPGDGTFTIERNPHAISELLRRISTSHPSIWQGVGGVKFSPAKPVLPKIPPASW